LPKNDSPLLASAESENESSVPVVAEPENETPAFKAVKEEISGSRCGDMFMVLNVVVLDSQICPK
ncbi:hypothetical protein Bpfe_017938, partial [Biomphalaria pfeifferi]